jgi:hypothetical protein
MDPLHANIEEFAVEGYTTLEGLSCHQAVLHSEQQQEQGVDDECFTSRPIGPVSTVFGTTKPLTKPIA